jgi:hypothetical protein
MKRLIILIFLLLLNIWMVQWLINLKKYVHFEFDEWIDIQFGRNKPSVMLFLDFIKLLTHTHNDYNRCQIILKYDVGLQCVDISKKVSIII